MKTRRRGRSGPQIFLPALVTVNFGTIVSDHFNTAVWRPENTD